MRLDESYTSLSGRTFPAGSALSLLLESHSHPYSLRRPFLLAFRLPQPFPTLPCPALPCPAQSPTAVLGNRFIVVDLSEINLVDVDPYYQDAEETAAAEAAAAKAAAAAAAATQAARKKAQEREKLIVSFPVVPFSSLTSCISLGSLFFILFFCRAKAEEKRGNFASIGTAWWRRCRLIYRCNCVRSTLRGSSAVVLFYFF